jgi:choline-sulfatase
MPAARPHIVLFVTDDHGHWAMGCAGHRELLTPSLDHLAATGTRLTNAFTPCPVCSPARASLLTGRLPSQHGIHDWLRWEEEGQRHPGIDGQWHLGQLLQAAGYHTGLIGKWHCGRDHLPRAGFDRWFSYQMNQYPHFGLQHFSDQGRPLQAQGYQAALLTDQAIDFIRRRPRDRPFFLYVSYVCTHTPLRGHPERLVAAYRGARFEDIPDEEMAPCHGWARMPWPHAAATHREELAQYYGAVSHIDAQVGRILDELDATEERAHTLIIYTSDHGHMNGHHGLISKGNATVPQNFLEESIRVPAVLSWPRALPPGRVLASPVDHCDLFCTVLDAGGALPDAATARAIHSPGTSFLPLLRGEAQPWRDAQFCEYGNARMIRSGDLKLIRRYPGPNGHFGDELYDLARDPRERTNCIADPAYRPAVEALGSRLDAHFARYEDPAHSGRDIARQPPCNPGEPWRILPKGEEQG